MRIQTAGGVPLLCGAAHPARRVSAALFTASEPIPASEGLDP